MSQSIQETLNNCLKILEQSKNSSNETTPSNEITLAPPPSKKSKIQLQCDNKWGQLTPLELANQDLIKLADQIKSRAIEFLKLGETITIRSKLIDVTLKMKCTWETTAPIDLTGESSPVEMQEPEKKSEKKTKTPSQKSQEDEPKESDNVGLMIEDLYDNASSDDSDSVVDTYKHIKINNSNNPHINNVPDICKCLGCLSNMIQFPKSITSTVNSKSFEIENQSISCRDTGIYMYQCLQSNCQKQEIKYSCTSIFRNVLADHRSKFRLNMKRNESEREKFWLSDHYFNCHSELCHPNLDLSAGYQVVYLENYGSAGKSELTKKFKTWKERIKPNLCDSNFAVEKEGDLAGFTGFNKFRDKKSDFLIELPTLATINSILKPKPVEKSVKKSQSYYLQTKEKLAKRDPTDPNFVCNCKSCKCGMIQKFPYNMAVSSSNPSKSFHIEQDINCRDTGILMYECIICKEQTIKKTLSTFMMLVRDHRNYYKGHALGKDWAMANKQSDINLHYKLRHPDLKMPDCIEKAYKVYYLAKLDPEDNKKLAESSKNSNHSKIFLINQKNEKINTLLQLWIDRLEPSMNKKTSTSSSSPSGYNPETEDQNLGNFDFHKFFKAGK